MQLINKGTPLLANAIVAKLAEDSKPLLLVNGSCLMCFGLQDGDTVIEQLKKDNPNLIFKFFKSRDELIEATGNFNLPSSNKLIELLKLEAPKCMENMGYLDFSEPRKEEWKIGKKFRKLNTYYKYKNYSNKRK